eukprot:356303-Chlamydomonas_euryale.AAC.1
MHGGSLVHGGCPLRSDSAVHSVGGSGGNARSGSSSKRSSGSDCGSGQPDRSRSAPAADVSAVSGEAVAGTVAPAGVPPLPLPSKRVSSAATRARSSGGDIADSASQCARCARDGGGGGRRHASGAGSRANSLHAAQSVRNNQRATISAAQSARNNQRPHSPHLFPRRFPTPPSP